MIRRSLPAIFATMISISAGAAPTSAQAPFGPVTEFGQARTVEVDTSEGGVVVEVGPWQRLEGKPSLDALPATFALAQPRDITLMGGITLKALPPVGAAMGLAGVEGRAGDLFVRLACDNDGERRHYRTIDVRGRMEAVLMVAGPGPDGLTRLLGTYCSEDPSKAKKAARKAAETAARHAAYRVAPGTGVGARDLVVAYNDTGLAATAGGAALRSHVWVTLDDGWAVKDPALPLSMIDADAHRAARPDDWARWKSRWGGKVLRQSPDGDWVPMEGEAIRPSRRGRRLNGSFDFHSSSMSPFNAHSRRDVLTFTPDGRYAEGSSGLSSSTLAESSIYSAGRSGPEGCSRTTSINDGIVGGISGHDPSCGDGKAGTYEIEGYTLTLINNRGEVRHLPFYVSRDGDGFVFDGRYFGRASKE